ncbi:TRAP transporter substrate-binding protein DctP [Leucobacter rhizosphaerae]|uniref:TRAP transporter substrate-binding protein DctP n=1 Tax=Leucobacter rhizosphaerae TaxID=2932245 RepID=A0ABY4FVI9_9MICO|nr:TRAP transporter substrate-binding protein DctP [Leucobacter rhizosphaerae]UOQ60300.1 TRAP transporter substrate-binding protein DctP [Leucobacter rhizosphaerae]
MFSSPTHTRRIGRLSAAAAMMAVAGLALAGCSGITNAGGGSGDGSGGGSGETVTFTLATGAQADTPNAAVQEWFMDRVEEVTEGRITFERTATEALCKAAEVADCVRDGRAQIGVTVPDYTPQYFPSTSMVSIPFLSQNAQAAMQSIYDLHNDYEPAVEIMERNGLHHVATWPVGRFLLGGHDPIESTEQFSGAQVRVSGPIIQQAIGDAGANIVAITAPETYEAVERGVVSNVGGAIDFPVNYKLMELLPAWTDPGIGQYSTFGMWVNAEAYNGLPDDLREQFDQVAEELNTGAGIEAFNEVAAGQCQQMLDSPSVDSLSAWSDDATQAWKDALGESGQQMWIDLATEQGLQDAEGVLDEYIAGLEQYDDVAYDDATSACVASFADR